MVSVEALEKVRGLHRVYNLEVEGAHENLVGEAGVRSHNSSALNGDGTARGLWKITKEGTSRVVKWGKGKSQRTIHQHKSTKLWWSKDTAGHGGSTWKVFKEEAGGLRHFKDADKYGDFIEGKHKGPVG